MATTGRTINSILAESRTPGCVLFQLLAANLRRDTIQSAIRKETPCQPAPEQCNTWCVLFQVSSGDMFQSEGMSRTELLLKEVNYGLYQWQSPSKEGLSGLICSGGPILVCSPCTRLPSCLLRLLTWPPEALGGMALGCFLSQKETAVLGSEQAAVSGNFFCGVFFFLFCFVFSAFYYRWPWSMQKASCLRRFHSLQLPAL